MTLASQPLPGMEDGLAGPVSKDTDQVQRPTLAGETTSDGRCNTSKEGSATEDVTYKGRKRRGSNRKITLEPRPSHGSGDLPLVTVELATPSPLPAQTRQPDENNNDDDQEEDDYEEEGEEEEVEEEEIETEMTPEEKKAMYEAVKSGDIDLLEDCLDKPNSDINMVWFRENLLMAAIKSGHQEMAEFLLDNGTDHNFKTSVVALRDTSKGKHLDRYEISCRQLAYDFGMLDIVELIDLLQGQLFPFIKPAQRCPRYRRPKPSASSESQDSSSSSSEAQTSDSSSHGSESDSEGSESVSLKLKLKKRRKKCAASKRTDLPDGADMTDHLTNNEDETAHVDNLTHQEPGHQRQEHEGHEVIKGEKRKKSKKKKERKRKGTVSEAAEGEEGETNQTGTGSCLDGDSGHHSMGSSKLKVAMLREHDKLSEQEEHGDAVPSSQGGLCPPDQTVEEKSYREAARTHSEKSTDAEASHAHDEGYGTVSAKSPMPSPSPEMRPCWALGPTNFIRSTKSSLSVQKIHGHRALPLSQLEDSVQDSPLKWRKVSTVGSYANESRQWHVTTSTTAQPAVKISHLNISPPHTAPPGTVTPSSRISSLPKSILKSCPSSPSTMLSQSCSQPEENDPIRPRTKPEAAPVASYMRPTKSTLTKKRLSPTFVTSYGALDFHYLPETRSGPYFVHSSKSSSLVRSRTSSSMSTRKSLAMPYLCPTNPQKRHHYQ